MMRAHLILRDHIFRETHCEFPVKNLPTKPIYWFERWTIGFSQKCGFGMIETSKKGDCASNGHDSFAKRWGNSSQYLAMLRGTSWRMLMEPAKMRRFTKDFGNLTQEGCWVWSYYVVQRWPSHPQATSFDPLSKLCGKHWPLFKGGGSRWFKGWRGNLRVLFFWRCTWPPRTFLGEIQMLYWHPWWLHCSSCSGAHWDTALYMINM